MAARAFLQLGRDDDAFEVARLAVSIPESTVGRQYSTVECHSVLGQVAAKRGDLEEAGGHFGRALEVAKASRRLPMLELLAAQEWKRAVSGTPHLKLVLSHAVGFCLSVCTPRVHHAVTQPRVMNHLLLAQRVERLGMMGREAIRIGLVDVLQRTDRVGVRSKLVAGRIVTLCAHGDKRCLTSKNASAPFPRKHLRARHPSGRQQRDIPHVESRSSKRAVVLSLAWHGQTNLEESIGPPGLIQGHVRQQQEAHGQRGCCHPPFRHGIEQAQQSTPISLAISRSFK